MAEKLKRCKKEQEKLDNDLIEAAKAGNIDRVCAALDLGADIHAANDCALRTTVPIPGYAPMVALLLERGADIHANHDEVIRTAYGTSSIRQTLQLIRAYDMIEQHISDAGSSKAIRSLAWRSAAIVALCDVDGSLISSIVETSLKKTFDTTSEARALKDGKARDILVWQKLNEESKPETLAQLIGTRGYLEALYIRDVVSEFRDAVLLPLLLVKARLTKKQIEAITEEQTNDLSEKLQPLAVYAVLGNSTVNEMLALNKEWHINGNALPHDLRPYLPDCWQKLMEDVETPFEYEGKKLVIRALSEKQALVNESFSLNHCVGRGSHYINECAAGKIHILSVQTKDGKPLATREVALTGNPKNPLEERQFHGQSDGAVPEVAKQAMDWFDEKLKNGNITFNQPTNGKWGKAPKIETKTPILERIGFEPTKENIRKCLDHYERHLLMKENFALSTRREGGFVRPREIKQDYRWRSAIRTAEIPATGAWHELVDSVASQYGGSSAMTRG
jgi:hypothetical protein